jgi:hypothetical protein
MSGSQLETFRTDRPSRKLDYRTIGPYKVLRCHNKACSINLPTRYHCSSNLSRLQATQGPGKPCGGPTTTPPSKPITVEDVMEYEVDQVRDLRLFHRRLRFKIRWRGYPQDPKWYPADNGEFDKSKDLIEDFYRQHPNKPRGQGFTHGVM